MEHLERNYKIVQETMMEQMEKSFAIGKKLIDTELDAGLLNFLVKPVVKAFYSYWTNTDARKGTIQQIRVTLDCGKRIVSNGISEQEANQLIEDNFKQYLEGDQTYRQCNKSHRNFQKLVDITKDCFLSQVKDTLKFLKVEKNVENYDELCKEVYQNRDNAYKALMRQLDYNEAGIKIVEQDPAILKIITGKKVIVNALRKGFNQTKTELIENLNNAFSN